MTPERAESRAETDPATERADDVVVALLRQVHTEKRRAECAECRVRELEAEIERLERDVALYRDAIYARVNR